MATNLNELSNEQIVEIATQAYTYGYPLVMMHQTKMVQTNVEKPTSGHAPINQVGKAQSFPTSETRDVVKPNVDTLYNLLWLDLTEEPIVVSVPYSGQNSYNSGGIGNRYCLFPFLDAYSNVYNSSGTRTSGSEPLLLFVYGPNYDVDTKGIPPNMDGVKCPTNMSWMLGRIQTDGEEDGQNFVWPLQQQINAVPYSQWLEPSYTPPINDNIDPALVDQEPVSVVKNMSISDFFNLMSQLMAENPYPSVDQPIVDQMELIGVGPNLTFDISAYSQETAVILEDIPNAIYAIWALGMKKKITENNEAVNNWVSIKKDMGVFGTDYLQRAFIAYKGLGANVIEDAMYPNCELYVVDGDEGNAIPLDASQNYIMTFDKEPPVGAFWSLTCYNADNFLVENTGEPNGTGKYCVGSIGNEIEKRNDGSFDIFIQNEAPESGTSNWLPSPSSGPMSLTLRFYLPDDELLTGRWNPPLVRLNS